jgi:hypothetical protein
MALALLDDNVRVAVEDVQADRLAAEFAQLLHMRQRHGADIGFRPHVGRELFHLRADVIAAGGVAGNEFEPAQGSQQPMDRTLTDAERDGQFVQGHPAIVLAENKDELERAIEQLQALTAGATLVLAPLHGKFFSPPAR